MQKRLHPVALALALGFGTGACGDFLTGPKLADNPNRPTTASNANLLVSAMTNLTFQQEGHLVRTVCIWMQQCGGTLRNYNTLSTYIVGDDDYFTEWGGTYIRGGLLDLRRIQTTALADADSGFAGVAAVLEAWVVGMAADTWGDIPYSQAVDSTIAEPVPDAQQDVYAALQAKLDEAIALMGATNAATTAPGPEDLVYGGDLSKWTELAYTLKARYHLHTAEQLGLPAYQAARDAALNGIAPDDDYIPYHSTGSTETNLWHQFTNQWIGFLSAGQFLVDLLDPLNPDPRLPLYFDPNSDGEFVGAAPGEDESVNPSPLSSTRLAGDFAPPFATYAENQLILAEAAWQLAGGGPAGNAAAQPYVSAERASLGLGALPVTGLATIMTEKYIVTFQNFEVWNDYKRTCIPALVPYTGAPFIPARLTYPLSERNANSSIPADEPLRNWNDPNPC
ncbi:MAG TPA: SusD/RagB family nutrient-binding outer membrane lipoprotein [Gemmatimonadales bacterium]|nr:SusD/RagB family nutrient-binding outer membrane lipoprotein [Gemmatimonadales bacterium]